MYKIILSDGSVVDNLELNGTNFVSNDKITKYTFAGKMDKVIIEGPDRTEEHGPMKLVQILEMDNKYYFILVDLTPDELWRRQIADILDTQDSKITYTAMMTDTMMEE